MNHTLMCVHLGGNLQLLARRTVCRLRVAYDSRLTDRGLIRLPPTTRHEFEQLQAICQQLTDDLKEAVDNTHDTRGSRLGWRIDALQHCLDQESGGWDDEAITETIERLGLFHKALSLPVAIAPFYDNYYWASDTLRLIGQLELFVEQALSAPVVALPESVPV